MFEIISFHEKFLPNVVALANKSFGNNYLTSEDIEKSFTNPYQKGIIALSDGVFAGFSFYRFINYSLLDSLFDESVVAKIRPYLTSDKLICLRQQTAVATDFRNNYFASQLVEYSLSDALHFRADSISVLWNSANDDMKMILLKMNFKVLTKISDYWYRDSLDKKYNCPICGKPPCRCSASIMLKKSGQ